MELSFGISVKSQITIAVKIGVPANMFRQVFTSFTAIVSKEKIFAPKIIQAEKNIPAKVAQIKSRLLTFGKTLLKNFAKVIHTNKVKMLFYIGGKPST